MRRTWRDLSWTTASLTVARALAFLSTILLARALDTSAFALYIVQVAVSGMLVPVFDAGQSTLVARVVTRDAAGRGPYLSYAAAAERSRSGLWALGIAAAGVAGFLGMWGHAALVLLSVGGAIGQALTDTMCGELWGRGRFAAAGKLRLVGPAIALVGAAVLPFIAPTAVGAMVVFAGSRLLPPLALRLRYRSSTHRGAGISLRAGFPFAVTTVLTGLYLQSDVVLLSIFGIPAAQLAAYGLVYQMVVALQLIPSAVGITFFPRMAAASPDLGRQMYRRAMLLSFTLSAVSSAAIVVSLQTLLGFAGQQYASEVDAVSPLLLIALPAALTTTTLTTLQAQDLEYPALRVVAWTLVLNLALHLLLIPLLGVRGAILSTMSAELFVSVALIHTAARAGLGDFRILVPTLMAAPIALSLLSAATWSVSVAILVGLAVLWAHVATTAKRAGRRLRWADGQSERQ